MIPKAIALFSWRSPKSEKLQKLGLAMALEVGNIL